MSSAQGKGGLSLVVLVLLAMPSQAAGPPRRERREEALRLAQRIDQTLAAAQAAKKVTPAPRADDAEFVRRVYLDLTGRIPRVSEVRAFLEDQRAN